KEEGDAARAASLRSQGNQAMLDMHYTDALAAYEEARRLAPEDVTVLYSLGRAHEFLGEYPEALHALESFREQASPEARARVSGLDDVLKEIRARVGTLTLRCNVAGARVSLRGRVIGTTPLPPQLRVAAGAAALQIDLDGFFPEKRDVV